MAKNGKTPKSKPIDSDRETRVLLENMDRNITRIAEAQSSTTAQIAEIKATMATKAELETVSMAAMTISREVKTLQDDVKEIKTDVKDLKGKVEEGLSNHGKRIIKLEEKVLV